MQLNTNTLIAQCKKKGLNQSQKLIPEIFWDGAIEYFLQYIHSCLFVGSPLQIFMLSAVHHSPVLETLSHRVAIRSRFGGQVLLLNEKYFVLRGR